jgi:hypothetical protein
VSDTFIHRLAGGISLTPHGNEIAPQWYSTAPRHLDSRPLVQTSVNEIASISWVFAQSGGRPR